MQIMQFHSLLSSKHFNKAEQTIIEILKADYLEAILNQNMPTE